MNRARRSLRPTPALLAAVISVALSGCLYAGQPDRTVYDIAGRRITVIDYSEPALYANTAPLSLVRIEDARGMDWIGEDEIVIGRPNPDVPKERARGATDAPQNLYVLAVADQRLSPLAPENAHQGYAQASPDRKKLFYKTFDPQARTGRGYILNLSSRDAFAFTEGDGMDVLDGRWAGNDAIVYTAPDGTVHFAHANGSQTKVLRRRDSQAAPDAEPSSTGSVAAFASGSLFFTGRDGQLSVLSARGHAEAPALRNVVSMIPSPAGDRLALVQTVAGGEMELIVADLEGNRLSSVAREAQIYGTAWSPDGSKLAYAAIAANGTVGSVQVANLAAGISAPLPVDIRFISDPLRWSPSGARLMIPAARSDEAQSRSPFVTFLVQVP